MNELISVIVPIYNVEQYLTKCLDSILNQSYRQLEIILVDDGSNDNCPSICDSYAKLDNRIKVIHKVNGGLSDARNAGLDVAVGDYIGFVDSDDWIEPTMYESLMEVCKEDGSEIACCGRFIAEDGKICGTRFSSKKQCFTVNEAFKEIFHSDKIDVAMWDKLYSSRLFHMIRFPVGENNEDIAVFYKILNQVNQISHCGKNLYYYRRRPGSITHSTYSPRATRVLYKNLDSIMDFILEHYPDLIEDYHSYLALNNYYLITAYIHANGISKADDEYRFLKERYNKDFSKLLNHKATSIKLKIAAVLVRIGLYGFVIRLRRRILGH